MANFWVSFSVSLVGLLLGFGSNFPLLRPSFGPSFIPNPFSLCSLAVVLEEMAVVPEVC